MTDEEMAEAWVGENGFGSDCNNINSVDANREMVNAFLAGLKTGRPKWHKVADGDLPNSQRIVEVFTKDKDVFIAYLDSEDDEWYIGKYFRKVLPMNDVIAWKEIELPEE